MTRQGMIGLLSAVMTLGLVSGAAAQTAVDAALPEYFRSTEQVKGKITLIGSDTMSTVASIWADNFKKLYPTVEIVIQVKGSANAVTSVVEGTADFGLLSRAISQEEVNAFQQKFGYLPHVLTPSLESIAIYVHKDNPIKSLTLAQLDAIFSTSLKRGASQPARTWGDLGLKGEWAKTPIVCHGRSAQTGSQVFFQAVVMGNGAFREDLIANQTNLDLVKGLTADKRAIGFAGSIYELPEIKDVQVAIADGMPPAEIMTPAYPLVRPLQLVINHNPKSKLPIIQSEFIKYIFSRQGQEDVVVGGFQSVPAQRGQMAIQSIGVNILN